MSRSIFCYVSGARHLTEIVDAVGFAVAAAESAEVVKRAAGFVGAGWIPQGGMFLFIFLVAFKRNACHLPAGIDGRRPTACAVEGFQSEHRTARRMRTRHRPHLRTLDEFKLTEPAYSQSLRPVVCRADDLASIVES